MKCTNQNINLKMWSINLQANKLMAIVLYDIGKYDLSKAYIDMGNIIL